LSTRSSEEPIDDDEAMLEYDPMKYNPMENLDNFGRFQKDNIEKAFELYRVALREHHPSPLLLNSMFNVLANALRYKMAMAFLDEEFPKHVRMARTVL
jgi:hypothetical protein